MVAGLHHYRSITGNMEGEKLPEERLGLQCGKHALQKGVSFLSSWSMVSVDLTPSFLTGYINTLRTLKAEMYAAGEELFALKLTPHPELVKTKKESCLLDQLYGLYMDVLQTLERSASLVHLDAYPLQDASYDPSDIVVIGAAECF